MRSRWFGLVVAALAVAMSVWAYPQLPPTVATHWNLNGTPDGFSSRLWALAIVPIVLIAMTVVFNVLPKVDPRRENYAKFLTAYWLIANAVILFLLVAHAMVIAAGLGFSVKIDRLMPLGIGLLFVFLGNYLTRVEPNWFIVAPDAPHRWRADGGWWIDPGDQCVPATSGVSRSVRRDDRHRRGHPDRAIVHPLETGTT